MLNLFFKFIKYYGKNRKLPLLFFLLISLLAGLMEFMGIGLIYPFLIMLVNPQFAMESNLYNRFLAFSHIENFSVNIIILAILIASIFFVKNILMIYCLYWQNKFVINWKTDINILMMKYYLSVAYKKILNSTLSEKVYNIGTLSAQTLEIFTFRFIMLTTNCIILFIILSLLFIKFFVIALFTVTFVILCMIGLNKFFKKRTAEIAPILLETSIKSNAQTLENCSNLKEIRIFSAENLFLQKFINSQIENNKVTIKNSFIASLPPYIVEIILVFTLILLAILITFQCNGDYSKIVASYGVLLVVLFRIAPILNKIQTSLNQINSSKNLVEKMNNEYEKHKFDEIKIPPKSLKELSFKESLKVENLNFEYQKNKTILKDINFEIKQGEFIGIIGLSGAGKTTLADILMGLLPVKSGKIYLDNVEITEDLIPSFRKIIGYVPQETKILDSDFKSNVGWQEDIDERKVIESLKSAQLLEVINAKGGIHSLANGLSQGQKQRLLIARALYKESQIIIFDEATSSLDVETEHEIIEMLKTLKRKKTIVTIAHRLVTLKECDRLIYLKEGEIVDIGTFNELGERHKDFEKLINLSKF